MSDETIFTYKEFKPIIKVKKPLWLRFKLWFMRKFTPKKYRKMLNLMGKCFNDVLEKEVAITITQLLYGSVTPSDSNEENYGPPIPANILAEVQKKINRAT